MWLAQLLSWILVIFVTKLVIAMVILLLEDPLGQLAIWLFTPLRPYPRVELALVMIACPCMMNAVQFWIQDSFLKKDVRDESTLVASSATPDNATLEEKKLQLSMEANAVDGKASNVDVVAKELDVVVA